MVKTSLSPRISGKQNIAWFRYKVIRHGDIGIHVRGLTSNTLVSGNRFQDVKTGVVADPASTLEIGSIHENP